MFDYNLVPCLLLRRKTFFFLQINDVTPLGSMNERPEDGSHCYFVLETSSANSD